MSNQQLILVRKKELVRQCNFEICKVVKIRNYEWDIYSLKKRNGDVIEHKNIVTFDTELADLVCTCECGTFESTSGLINENRCKHIQSVREMMSK